MLIKMTGTFNTTSAFKQEKIKELTLKGNSPAVIAQRLNLHIGQVHYFQRKLGLRKSLGKKK
jgi:hypothetical protein